MSKWNLTSALTVLLGLSAVAATGLAATTQPVAAADKTLRIAVPFGPKSSAPDPRARQNGWLSNRAGVSETLIGLGHDMTMQPRLAESFANVSPTEWRLVLRSDVKFHDGSAMTAEDVKASFEKLDIEGHPGHNPRLSRLLGIESITVENENTLLFKTKKPNSAFLWSLTEPSAAVMKEGTEELPLIGTGPFVFVSAETDKNYETRKFADYWGGEPKLDRIVMDALSDPSVAKLALQAGDVDLVTNFPEPDFAALQGSRRRPAVFQSDDPPLFLSGANGRRPLGQQEPCGRQFRSDWTGTPLWRRPSVVSAARKPTASSRRPWPPGPIPA